MSQLFATRPAQTSGAMANTFGTGRVYTTPARSSRFQSPGVSARAFRIGPTGKISEAFSRTTQGVPFVNATRRRVSTPAPVGRGPRSFRSNVQAGTMVQIESTPRPCRTLISRMAISAISVAVSPDRRDNQKSVDKTKYEFKRRFSGAASEDWMAHIDALELDRAKKHNWTAKNFFMRSKIR